MKKLWVIAGILVLALGGWLIYRHFKHTDAPTYRFAGVERGDVDATVSSTGILGAVKTVQVGTQVSGQIAATFADFNDHVKKGQLVARIDPVLQEQAVANAQATLDRNRAQLEQSRIEYERNKKLFEGKVLTEVEFNTAKYAFEVAQANEKSAEIALKQAQQNLGYTAIYSPIDGVVVERDVDVGQTVASSYSTPQLFLIAQDLSQMQILASVDESDIGQMKQGQPVHFTVQAFPNETFQGTVTQVRLQSKTTENVVNYTVVVGVRNPGKLLPGMTATVDFVTGSASDVLTVPNAALRFRPPQEELEKLRAQWSARAGARGAVRGQGAAPGANSRRTGSRGMLWQLDAAGKLAPLRVRIGLTDGQKTQVEGPTLKEGMQVIVGSNQVDQTAANPFQPGAQQQRGGVMRRGPF